MTRSAVEVGDKQAFTGTPDEHARAAALAAGHAGRAAADLDDGFYHRLWRDGKLRLRRGRRGVDDEGPYVVLRLTFTAVRERHDVKLRTAPAALTVDQPTPDTVQAAPGATLWVRYEVRALALRCGWSEAQAFRYLITHEPPRPSPLVVRQVTGLAADGTTLATSIAVLALPGVSVTSVARAYSEAVGRKGRQSSARTVALVEYVKRVTAENGGRRPPLSKLREGFRRDHPQHKAFRSDANLNTTLGRNAPARAPKVRRRPRG